MVSAVDAITYVGVPSSAWGSSYNIHGSQEWFDLREIPANPPQEWCHGVLLEANLLSGIVENRDTSAQYYTPRPLRSSLISSFRSRLPSLKGGSLDEFNWKER